LNPVRQWRASRPLQRPAGWAAARFAAPMLAPLLLNRRAAPWSAEAVRVLKFGGCRCIGPGHEIGRFPSAEIAIGADLRQAFQDKPSAALTARIASHWSRYSTAKPRSSTSVTQTTPAGFATLPALSTVICCQSRRFSGHDCPVSFTS